MQKNPLGRKGVLFPEVSTSKESDSVGSEGLVETWHIGSKYTSDSDAENLAKPILWKVLRKSQKKKKKR